MTSFDDGASADENKKITGDENYDEMSREIDLVTIANITKQH
jgi:hypothetical protein